MVLLPINAARLVAIIVPRFISGICGTWVVLDRILGDPPGKLVIGLAMAEIEPGFQIRIEAIPEVGDDPLALAGRVVLIAIGARIGHRHVVVEVAQHLPGADLPLLVAVATGYVAHLQQRRIVASVADVVDGTAQCQSAAVKTIGAAQHLYMVEPQRLE